VEYKKKIFARTLRKEQTPEEVIVWGLLRNRKFMNLKFRRQHVIEGFIVDFYCHELRLAIEIDGRIHDRQKDYDELRQGFIEERRVSFIRVTNDEVSRDVNILLNSIKEFALKDIKIERITEKDISGIVDLWYEVSIKAHNFIPASYWESNREDMKEKYIPMSETYAAKSDEEILGFISLMNEYVAAIFVKTEMQGMGVGTYLLNHAKSLRSSLQLKVFSKNMKSIDFYKAKGFAVIAEARDEDTGEDELVLQWNK